MNSVLNVPKSTFMSKYIFFVICFVFQNSKLFNLQYHYIIQVRTFLRVFTIRKPVTFISFVQYYWMRNDAVAIRF